MTIIPFRAAHSRPKAVADFTRVCDAAGLQLRDEDVSAVLDRIAAELEPNPPQLPKPHNPDDV